MTGATATSRIRIQPEKANAKALTAKGRLRFRQTASEFAANFRFGGTDFHSSNLSVPLEKKELAPLSHSNYITGIPKPADFFSLAFAYPSVTPLCPGVKGLRGAHAPLR